MITVPFWQIPNQAPSYIPWWDAPSTSSPNTLGGAPFRIAAPEPRPLNWDMATPDGDKNVIVVKVKLPGYAKENISLSLDREYLYIKATSDSAFIGKTYEESIVVPECDCKAATFENGILTVTLQGKNTKVDIPLS